MNRSLIDRLSCFFLLWCLLSHGVALSGEKYEPVTLMYLYESGDYKGALEYARQFNNLERHADFYYYYGLAASRAGQPNEAVSALEHLLMLEPDNHVIKAELADTYRLSGQHDKSRAIREELNIKHAKPGKKHINSGNTQGAPFAFFETGLGVDDNANNNPRVDSLLARAIIDSVAVAGQRDNYWRLQGGIGWRQPLSADNQLSLSLESGGQYYQDFSEFDFAYHDIEARFERDTGAYYAGLGFNIERLSIDSENYRDIWAFDFDWRSRLVSKADWLLNIQYADQAYAQESFRDAALLQVELGVYALLGSDIRPVDIRFALLGGHEEADSSSVLADLLVARDFNGVELEVNISPGQRFDAGIMIMQLHSDYDGAGFTNLRIDREDDYQVIDVMLRYQINAHWSAEFTWFHGDNDTVTRAARFFRQVFGRELAQSFSQSVFGLNFRYDWGS